MPYLKITNKLVIATITFTLLLFAPLAAAQDQAAAQKAAEAEQKAAVEEFKARPLEVTGIDPYVGKNKGIPGDPDNLGQAGMGDRISVDIPRLGFAAKHNLIDPNKLVLFIDGRVFKDVHPKVVGADNIVYELERTPDAAAEWKALLENPLPKRIKPVVISVGYSDQKPLKLADKFLGEFQQAKPNLQLIVYRKSWLYFAIGILLVTLVLFWRYGRTALLRDSAPANPPDGKFRPYSLAKVQAAWWFFIVLGSFFLIYLVTGEYIMTEQALLLIGIGSGTALFANKIDASKRSTADDALETLRPQEARLKAELDLLDQQISDAQTAIGANTASTEAEKAALQTDRDALAAKKIDRAEKNEKLEALRQQIADARAGLQKPVSTGFWDDIVTDVDGPSFHRLQMIVWTVVLGVLFLAGVYKNLTMPEFNVTMLALMGISAGTYLGFKVPEKQTTGEPTGDSATTSTTNTTAATDADELDGHDMQLAADTPDEALPITVGGVQ